METQSTIAHLVSWVIAHGYFLFFVAAFLEGILVTTAAGVAAGLGYYNIEIIILLSILGDLVADTVYYSIGYFGGRPLIKRCGRFVGLTQARFEKLQNLLHRHANKIIIAVKLSPVIAVPGIIVIGSVHVPVKKFIALALAVTGPRSIFFALLGFFSARAYEHLSGIVSNTQLVLFGLVVLVMGIYFLYKKAIAKLSKTV